jgi:hypothetical protein
MAWRSSGTTNDEMVDNLKRKFCNAQNSCSFPIRLRFSVAEVLRIYVKFCSIPLIWDLEMPACRQKSMGMRLLDTKRNCSMIIDGEKRTLNQSVAEPSRFEDVDVPCVFLMACSLNSTCSCDNKFSPSNVSASNL